MHQDAVSDCEERRRWAYDDDLESLTIEWHERDLGGGLAAVLVVNGDSVIVQVERTLMRSPAVWLVRPWAMRAVATGWEVAVAPMAALAALMS